MTPTSMLLAGALAGLVSTLTSVARAQDASPQPYSAEAAPWEARIGYRGSWVESPGYSPFSTNDYLPEFSLGASRLVLARGRFSLTAGAAWDYGATGRRREGRARRSPCTGSRHRWPFTIRSCTGST